MKNLTKLVKNIPRTIELGLAGAVLCGTMSCASMTKAQKTALLGQTLSILGSINTPGNNTVEGERAKEILRTSGNVISNQAQMQHDLEYANAGKSETIINNNVPNGNQAYESFSGHNQGYANMIESHDQLLACDHKDNSTPKGFFVYEGFVDFDQDNVVNGKDFVGMNQSVYDLRDLGGVHLAFHGDGKLKYASKNMNISVYNLEDGKMIKQFDSICKAKKIHSYICKKESFPKSGKYRAVLKIRGLKSTFIDFEIIK